MRHGASLVVLSSLLPWVLPLTAQSPLPGRDVDDLNPPPLRFGPVTVGGYAGLRTEQREDTQGWLLRPSLRLFARMPLGESAELRSRFSIRHRQQIGTENALSESDFEIQEAHVRWWPGSNRNFRIRIGRQRFRDTREWYVDDFLDAVQLCYQTSLVRLEFALAKGLAGGTSRREQFHLIGDSRFTLPGRRYASARFLKRVDTGRQEELTWLGFGSRGRVAGDLRYWFEHAILRGSDRKVPVRAWGNEFGLSYRFRASLRPTISALYAVGSGDGDASDRIDSNFRQTRLNGNTYRYNGLRRRAYYGRILAPELSNIRVMSVDFGLRSGNRWSFNLSAHDYRQVHPSTHLGETRLDLSSTGTDDRLGRELNASFVWRRAPRLDLIFDAGVMLPGPALPQAPRWVYGFRQELRYYF